MGALPECHSVLGEAKRGSQITLATALTVSWRHVGAGNWTWVIVSALND